MERRSRRRSLGEDSHSDDSRNVYERLSETPQKVSLEESTTGEWSKRMPLSGTPFSKFAANLRTPSRKVHFSKKQDVVDQMWIESLYEDAAQRRYIRQRRSLQKELTLLNRPNTPGMSNSSFDLVFHAISKSTKKVFDKLKTELSNWIFEENFEKLLIHLGLLPTLKHAGVKFLDHLQKEHPCVERLWQYLCEEVTKDEGKRKAVSIDSIHNFIVLVESFILDNQIREEMENLFLKEKNSESVGFLELIKEYAELKISNKSYEEMGEECEHQKVINANAKQLTVKKKKKAFSSTLRNLLAHTRKVEEKVEKLRAKISAQELLECTFEPKIIEYNARQKKAVAPPKIKKAVAKVTLVPNLQAKNSARINQRKLVFSEQQYPNGYKRHLRRMSYLDSKPSGYSKVMEEEKYSMMEVAFCLEMSFEGHFVSVPVYKYDNALDIAKTICKRLFLPQKEMKTLEKLIKDRMRAHHCQEIQHSGCGYARKKSPFLSLGPTLYTRVVSMQEGDHLHFQSANTDSAVKQIEDVPEVRKEPNREKGLKQIQEYHDYIEEQERLNLDKYEDYQQADEISEKASFDRGGVQVNEDELPFGINDGINSDSIEYLSNLEKVLAKSGRLSEQEMSLGAHTHLTADSNVDQGINLSQERQKISMSSMPSTIEDNRREEVEIQKNAVSSYILEGIEPNVRMTNRGTSTEITKLNMHNIAVANIEGAVLTRIPSAKENDILGALEHISTNAIV